MGSKEIELAWAAGFYDGEGSTRKILYHYKSKKGVPRKPNENMCMSASQAELEPLERFQRAVSGLGRINGPYQYKSNRRPYWVWSASCSAARQVYLLLEPYLSGIKKKQYERVVVETQPNPDRKKGWIHDQA